MYSLSVLAAATGHQKGIYLGPHTRMDINVPGVEMIKFTMTPHLKLNKIMRLESHG